MDTEEVFSERDPVGWAGFVEVVLVVLVLVVLVVLVLVLVVLVLDEVVPVVEPEVVVEVSGGAVTVVVVVAVVAVVVAEEEVAAALVVEGAAAVTLELTQPVNALSVVTEQVSAEALPVAVMPRAAAMAPASDAARALTRRSVILVRTDILRAARGFFTTSGSIGTLHVDLETCNLEEPIHGGLDVHSSSLTLESNVRSWPRTRSEDGAGFACASPG